jgi:hypothetical protein
MYPCDCNFQCIVYRKIRHFCGENTVSFFLFIRKYQFLFYSLLRLRIIFAVKCACRYLGVFHEYALIASEPHFFGWFGCGALCGRSVRHGRQLNLRKISRQADDRYGPISMRMS